MAASDKNQRDARRRVIGRRLRRRRLFLKMTQGALARAMGVSFQLIQKYENGKTRLPENRLAEICHHLDVTPDYFSAEGTTVTTPDAEALEYFVLSREGIALYRSISALTDVHLRARLVMAVAAFCDSHVRPEDKDIRHLKRWLKGIAMSSGRAQQKQTVEAAIRAMKIEMAGLVGNTLKARALTESFTAQILGTDQGRISALARGRIEGSSLEKLLRFVLLLGWDAGITLSRRPMGRQGKLAITARDGA